MLPYHNIDSDIITIGPLRVRWYGIMYLLGFLAGRVIMRRLCRQKFLRMPVERVDDFLVALFAGMLIGARLVYMLVYYRLSPDDPFTWYTPFAVWKGGLAFHGGALGMFAAIAWFGWHYHVRYWNLADALTLSAPVGVFLGRIGNFINGELYGRETSLPWGMIFPNPDYDGTNAPWTAPRHPSQLYEALGEGLMTLAVVWMAKRYIRNQGVITGVGIIWYASVRFCLELFREPDKQLGYYFGWMTMGQMLCLVMLAIGVAVCVFNARRRIPVDAPA
ncbi:MAG: prolipoprotein diacylglyceryl transferase [bacterium]|nr:prolipoprotein diacylglyceryl transferase [Candidatus Sumerlaeota bacterium]